VRVTVLVTTVGVSVGVLEGTGVDVLVRVIVGVGVFVAERVKAGVIVEAEEGMSALADDLWVAGRICAIVSMIGTAPGENH
jgi:hypothetical protein